MTLIRSGRVDDQPQLLESIAEPEQIQGRGMLAGILSSEGFLRRKQVNIDCEDGLCAPDHTNGGKSRVSAMGKYAGVLTSEEIIQRKQEDIVREDAPHS